MLCSIRRDDPGELLSVPQIESSCTISSQPRVLKPGTSRLLHLHFSLLLPNISGDPFLPNLRPAQINSPVRPLLVQHTVSALFAADGVAALQRDLVVAVTAQVVHRARRVFETAAARLEASVGGAGYAAEVGLADGLGAGLGLFAGHISRDEVSLVRVLWFGGGV
jgi:hypothetical protein